jgi:type II secretory pathway pseudopilin PulG
MCNLATHPISPRLQPEQRTVASVAALSLIEVMISIAVLAVGLMGVMSTISTLSSGRKQLDNTTNLNQMVQNLAEGLQGTRFSDLRSTTVPWSMGRYEDGTTPFVGGDRTTPMTDDPAAGPLDCLLFTNTAGQSCLGLLSKPTGYKNLKVYLEYFKGANRRDADDVLIDTGIMDQGYTSAAQYSSNLGTFKLIRSPSTQDDPENPVFIRILVTWGTALPTERYEYFTAIRKR